MKKLRLPLDELKVDSFDVAEPVAESKGTVEGYISINGTCPRPCTFEVSYCICE